VLPDPLHPAVVHFPIVLAVLLPAVALVALWAVHRGARVSRAWAVPVAFAAALALSAWVAVETGESQEERVERVVPESAMDTHAEAAETFLYLAAGLLVFSAAGLARGTVGRAARWVATAGAVGVMAVGINVGHKGGLLVYQHGAASAYAGAAPGPVTPGVRPAAERGEMDAGQ